MLTASSGIWTRVAESITNDYKRYALTSGSKKSLVLYDVKKENNTNTQEGIYSIFHLFFVYFLEYDLCSTILATLHKDYYIYFSNSFSFSAFFTAKAMFFLSSFYLQ